MDRGVYYNEKLDPLSANLFFMEGQKWRNLRAKISPTFTSGKLKVMFHTVSAVTEELLGFIEERLEVSVGGKCLEIKDLMSRFTTDIIGTIAFGISCDSLHNPQSEFRKMGNRIVNTTKSRAITMFLGMVNRGLARKLNLRFIDSSDASFFMDVIRQTISQREQQGTKRNDFMDLMLQLKNKGKLDDDGEETGGLSFEEIAAQCWIFYFAGFETSSTTITVALHQLSQHQDFQERAREEVERVLEKYGGKFTYEAVMEMEFLGQIVNETLRLFPPVGTIHRISNQEYRLPSGAVMPRGTFVVIPNMAYQYDEEIFPDAQRFDPDRFRDEARGERHNFAFIPFGEGPRICVGMRFGLLVVRIALAQILRQYRLTLNEKTSAELEINSTAFVHTPKNDIWLNLEAIHLTMSGFDILLLLVAVIFLGVSYFKRKYRYWEDRGVPYIKPIFPKGNIGTMGKTDHFFELSKKFYLELKGEGRLIGGIYLVVRPAALTLDLDFVKTVLVKDFQYFHDRGLYVNERDDPLSGHLLTIEGERWKNLRSKLSPTFTSGKMKLMFPIMMDISEKFITRLNEELVENSNLELGDYLSRFTIDIIGSCAFGLDCNSLNDPDAEFLAMGKKALTNSGGRARAAKRLFITSFRGLSKLLRLQLTRKDITDFYTRIVKETVAYRENENVKRDDFLNLLIQLKNKGKLDDDPGKDIGKITLNEVISNAFLFLLAGFETSSTTMKFCLLELANAIEIQDRLREEIKTVLERYDNKITYEALSEMKYLDQVINETLRKHPVGGLLVRSLKDDYKVPKMDVVLEKGTQLFIPVLAIHHDPDIYPDPDKFDPERFTPEAVKSRHPYAFLAFGEGPRNCIGMRFGMMQTKIGISCLLMNYKFSPCAKTKYPIEYMKSSALLSPIGDCWFKVDKIVE
ncbi:cytochrome P450 6A1-like [Phlebotomus argentipes]|uniref:cytochrome P450 6A1-like n=1 Tax=Phlebotomus argentipes TaxID=94469 RepID=UPI002892D2E0|nr:cytochrome P450 6A1-like [Phlebotomus argentipes]